MLWDEVKRFYPDKWIIYVKVNQHEQNNNIVKKDNLAVIEIFCHANDAYRYYCRVNRKNKNQEIRIANTREDELSYEFKKTSSSYKFKRAY